MKLDAAMIDQLARLARMDILDSERPKFIEQLPRIMAYVGKLQSVKTEQVAPERDHPARLRDDQVEPSQTATAIIDAAPDRAEKFWKVKAVM